jgi:mannose-6-phosphate isomerase-like protein (cupin superfamily)
VTDWLVRFEDFRKGVETSGRAHVGLRRGSMRVLLFQPTGADDQQPHKQDEIYIVRSGRGEFVKNGQHEAFGSGDVIFVEAGAEHRFVATSDDFSAWVVFWGPEGGEG